MEDHHVAGANRTPEIGWPFESGDRERVLRSLFQTRHVNAGMELKQIHKLR